MLIKQAAITATMILRFSAKLSAQTAPADMLTDEVLAKIDAELAPVA